MTKSNYNNKLNEETLTKKRTKKKLKKPSLYKVIMINDDYTPMDFVVYLLKNYFYKNQQEANRIMLDVHNNGSGTCGIFTLEIAESKILKVINYSRNNGYPLLCVLKKI